MHSIVIGSLFGGEDWMIVVIVALVLFGGSQLPKLARSLGEAQKELKKAMTDDDEPAAPAASAPAPPAPAAIEPAAEPAPAPAPAPPASAPAETSGGPAPDA